MPRIATPYAIGGAASRCASLVAGAWRALTPRRILCVSLLAAVWSAIELTSRILAIPRSPSWSPLVNAVLGLQLNALSVAFAVGIADQESPPPLRRAWPYVFAVAVGVFVGSSLSWIVSQAVLGIPTALQLRGLPDGYSTFAFRQAVHGFLVCGMATYVYASHRFAAHRLAALRAVQLSRTAVEKRVVESQLAAMQARVDPQFLLDTLARVEGLYKTDQPAADRALKDLTSYLRAAIPQMGEPVSTITKEILLANAYVRVAGRISKDLLLVRGEDASIADSARIPPMVLLPLLDHALAHRPSHASGAEPFAVGVAVSNDRLRLTLRDPDLGFAATDAGDSGVRLVRERLTALYGDAACLTFKEADGCTEAVLEIPHQVVVEVEYV